MLLAILMTPSTLVAHCPGQFKLLRSHIWFTTLDGKTCEDFGLWLPSKGLVAHL